MKKTTINKTKNTSSSKEIKLPLINQNKKTINRNDKNNSSSQKQRTSSTSQLSKNSSKANNITLNDNKKQDKSKRNSKKINDIINNVNKSHNINSKITSNNNEIGGRNSSPKNNQKIRKGNSLKKLTSPKSAEKSNRKRFNTKKDIQLNYQSFNSENNNKLPIYNSGPRITKEKLKEIQERRRLRLIREKKEFEMEMKNLNENNNKNYSNNNSNINSNNKQKEKMEFSNKINSPIQISQKKAQSILEEGGMIDAYKYLISHLCKNGMPPGNLYEYCSILIKNYEKEWKKKKYKLLNDKIQKYFEDKKKSFIGLNNINNNLQYKVLEKREENQFIKKLDHSRSTLRIIRKNPIMSTNLINKNSNHEMKSNKSSIFEKNKNKFELKKFNGENIILNASKKINPGNDKKVYFNIKLKNAGEDKNEGGKSNNTSFINNTKNNSNSKNNTKSKNASNNKLIKNIKINNNTNNKKENNKSNIKETNSSNKNNNISTIGKKENNKNERKGNSKSNLKVVKSNKSIV